MLISRILVEPLRFQVLVYDRGGEVARFECPLESLDDPRDDMTTVTIRAADTLLAYQRANP